MPVIVAQVGWYLSICVERILSRKDININWNTVFGVFNNTKIAIIVFSIVWIVSMPIMAIIWEHSFYCVSAFAIGVWMGFFYNYNKISVRGSAILIIIFAAIGVGYYYIFRQNWIIDNIASNIIAFSFIVLLGLMNIEKSRILIFLGKHSFSLYIFQGKIIFGWFPYQNFTVSIRLLVFVVLFFANIFIAVVFDWIIKMFTDNIK